MLTSCFTKSGSKNTKVKEPKRSPTSSQPFVNHPEMKVLNLEDGSQGVMYSHPMDRADTHLEYKLCKKSDSKDCLVGESSLPSLFLTGGPHGDLNLSVRSCKRLDQTCSPYETNSLKLNKGNILHSVSLNNYFDQKVLSLCKALMVTLTKGSIGNHPDLELQRLMTLRSGPDYCFLFLKNGGLQSTLEQMSANGVKDPNLLAWSWLAIGASLSSARPNIEQNSLGLRSESHIRSLENELSKWREELKKEEREFQEEQKKFREYQKAQNQKDANIEKLRNDLSKLSQIANTERDTLKKFYEGFEIFPVGTSEEYLEKIASQRSYLTSQKTKYQSYFVDTSDLEAKLKAYQAEYQKLKTKDGNFDAAKIDRLNAELASIRQALKLTQEQRRVIGQLQQTLKRYQAAKNRAVNGVSTWKRQIEDYVNQLLDNLPDNARNSSGVKAFFKKLKDPNTETRRIRKFAFLAFHSDKGLKPKNPDGIKFDASTRIMLEENLPKQYTEIDISRMEHNISEAKAAYDRANASILSEARIREMNARMAQISAEISQGVSGSN